MYFVIFLKCFWRTAQFVDYGLSSVFSLGSGWVRSETELFMTQFFVELSRMPCVTSSTQNVTLSWSTITRQCCPEHLGGYARGVSPVIEWWSMFDCRAIQWFSHVGSRVKNWIFHVGYLVSTCFRFLYPSLLIAVAWLLAEWGREALPCILSNDVAARELA